MNPIGITVDSDGAIIVSDEFLNGGSIWRVDPASGNRTLISEDG